MGIFRAHLAAIGCNGLKEEIQEHNLTESGKLFQVEITEGTNEMESCP